MQCKDGKKAFLVTESLLDLCVCVLTVKTIYMIQSCDLKMTVIDLF